MARRIVELAAVPEDVVADIETAVRRDWGGDRPYVRKIGESSLQARTRREQSIRADYKRGVHVAALARKWELSIRRVQQIVRG